MKRRILIPAVLLFLVFALCSCRSLNAIIKSNMTGLPVWYYENDMGVEKGYRGLVGEGVAYTQRQAELLSYSDVLAKLSDILGYELGQEEYRELSVLGTLTEFNLSVNDTFLSILSDGTYVFYVHVAIDEDLLDKATTEEAKTRNQIMAQVEDLVLRGDEFVKTGQETRAAKNYLQAMALSYGHEYIDYEYSFDELLDVVIGLLKNASLSFVSERPAEGTCTLSLSRKGTFASSAVKGAEVLATYTAIDTRGIEYEDKFVFVTDDQGQFSFNTINQSLARKGTVLFKLNLYEELETLEKLAGAEALSELRELLDSKQLVFSYDKAYSMGSIAVAVIEHDELGYVTGARATTDYLTAKLMADGAQAAAFYAELDEEEDVLYELTHSAREEEWLLVIRVGLTGQIYSESGVYCASAEGLVTLFNTEYGFDIYQSEIIRSNAFADNAPEAVADAFRTLADIAYTLIKAVYV